MIRQGQWGHPQLDVNHLELWARHWCLKKLILRRFTLWEISWWRGFWGTYVNSIEVTRSYPVAVLLNEHRGAPFRAVGVIHTWTQQTSQLISSISLPCHSKHHLCSEASSHSPEASLKNPVVWPETWKSGIKMLSRPWGEKKSLFIVYKISIEYVNLLNTVTMQQFT